MKTGSLRTFTAGVEEFFCKSVLLFSEPSFSGFSKVGRLICR